MPDRGETTPKRTRRAPPISTGGDIVNEKGPTPRIYELFLYPCVDDGPAAGRPDPIARRPIEAGPRFDITFALY
jgi:hypothetical protein